MTDKITARYALGGFVNFCISGRVFEKLLYDNIELYGQLLGGDEFLMLLEADMESEEYVGALCDISCVYVRDRLKESYPSDIYNDAFFEREENKGTELGRLYAASRKDLTEITLDFTGLKTRGELWNKITRSFGLPHGSVTNWLGLLDFISFADTRLLSVKGYSDLQRFSDGDADWLRDVFEKAAQEGCRIIIDY